MKKIIASSTLSILCLGFGFFPAQSFAASCANPDPEFGCPGDFDKAVYDSAKRDGLSDAKASERAGGYTPPASAPSGGSSDIGMGGAGGCAGGNISDVSTCLNQYKPKGTLSVGDGSLSGGGGVKAKIIAIANRVIVIVAIVAIGAIVMAGFHMVTAYGDDEKHKKGKEALKWGIIGFATSLVSFALVNAVINFLYNIG